MRWGAGIVACDEVKALWRQNIGICIGEEGIQILEYLTSAIMMGLSMGVPAHIVWDISSAYQGEHGLCDNGVPEISQRASSLLCLHRSVSFEKLEFAAWNFGNGPVGMGLSAGESVGVLFPFPPEENPR